ncbi:LexA family transcriptional regulator [Pseudomonas sp. USHLN015]|uniref:LexA family transcriptional regulator n=1 Tax=Pseudomonas sp. USHLN015 TaxID=3081296 RepID=UPI00301C40EA
MSDKKRELTQSEKDECSALKAALERFNAGKSRKDSLTQGKIAEALDMSQGSVSSYLNGYNALNLRFASYVAREIGVPVRSFSERLHKELESIAWHEADAARSAGARPIETKVLTSKNVEELEMLKDLNAIQAAVLQGKIADGGHRLMARQMRKEIETGVVSSAAPVTMVTAASANESSITEDEEHVYIPQLDAKVAAGQGEENPHVEVRGTLAFKKSWIKRKGLKIPRLTVIFATGTSMEPTFYAYDALLINEESRELKDGRVFAFRNREGENLVKRAVKEKGAWILRSDNPDKSVKAHQDMPFADEEGQCFEVIGQVIWRGGDL